MPRSTSFSLVLGTLRTALVAFVLGVAVAISFLLISSYCNTCLSAETPSRVLLSMQAVLWPTGHRHSLVPGSSQEAGAYYDQIARAVLENGLVYSACAASVWVGAKVLLRQQHKRRNRYVL